MIEVKRIIKKAIATTGLETPLKTIFSELEFETTSYCNRKCDYCPNVDYERFGAEEKFFMAESTFLNLVCQLKKLDFKGQISPHLYGEPLIDPRIYEWIGHLKRELPAVKIKIVTNADFLTEETFNILDRCGLDILYISKHAKTLSKQAKAVIENHKDNHERIKIVINDFYNDFLTSQEMFTNRGGDIDLKSLELKRQPIRCPYALYPVINSFGDLVICCQDFHNEYVFGNINDRDLGDIWFDPNNIEIRTRIYRGEMDLGICKTCMM